MLSVLSNIAHLFQSPHRYDDGSDEPVLEHLRRLRSHLWEKNVIEDIQPEEGRTYSIIDLTLFSRLHNCHGRILLIRDEYIRAYDTILAATIVADTQNLTTRPASFLVIGQSGIGKTLFLLYLMVRRLQECQPVAFLIENYFALFDEHGVSLHPAGSEKPAWLMPHGTWALFDSSRVPGGQPCAAFSRQYPGIHTIHTSSPAARHWKGWKKERAAITYLMDVWSQ